MTKNAKHTDLSSRLQPSDVKKTKAWAQLTLRYLDHLPAQIEAIASFLDTNNFKMIKDAAHRIKGTSGTYRLSAIAKGAAQLEIFADNENLKGIAATAKEMLQSIADETKKRKQQPIPTSNDSERPKNG